MKAEQQCLREGTDFSLSTYLLESGFGPLGTSCLLSTSPAEFHRRARDLPDLAKARRPPAATWKDDDDTEVGGSLAVPSPGGAARGTTATSAMAQRRAQTRSSSARAGALRPPAHRALAMQEPAQEQLAFPPSFLPSFLVAGGSHSRATPMNAAQAMRRATELSYRCPLPLLGDSGRG